MKTKRLTTILLSIILIISFTFPAFAANAVPAPDEWISAQDKIFANDGKISLTVGEKNGDSNFSWVTVTAEKKPERFIYGKESDLSDAKEVEVTTYIGSSLLYVANRVSLKDLDEGVYYYNYTHDGKWQGIENFNINDDENGFSVMLCSDPQLGRSGDDSDKAVLDDAYGWNRTLEAAKRNCPDMSFILCAGDQVNSALNKKQYNALLYPDILKSTPVASAVGNHDYYSPLYSLHYNNPNTSAVDSTSMGGNGYYFTYGDALFIVLNSNNYMIEEHRALLSTAINSAPNAKWRVVMMHTSLYYSGMKEKDQNNIELFAPLFDKFDIDLVVSGHEHLYSRTAPMTADKQKDGGVTYLAVATASGCSFDRYDRYDSRVIKSENLYEPSYSILDFGENEIHIKSYYTDTDEAFDEFSVTKAEKASSTVEYEYTNWLTKFIKTMIAVFALFFK